MFHYRIQYKQLLGRKISLIRSQLPNIKTILPEDVKHQILMHSKVIKEPQDGSVDSGTSVKA